MHSILAAVTQRDLWNEAQIKELVRQQNAGMVQTLHDQTTNVSLQAQPGEFRTMLLFAAEKERTR
jgi:uncharacterized protein involved in outer membrane biogenesis